LGGIGFTDDVAERIVFGVVDLEGVVAKELASGYRPGRRGGAWLKIKCGRCAANRPRPEC